MFSIKKKVYLKNFKKLFPDYVFNKTLSNFEKDLIYLISKQMRKKTSEDLRILEIIIKDNIETYEKYMSHSVTFIILSVTLFTNFSVIFLSLSKDNISYLSLSNMANAFLFLVVGLLSVLALSISWIYQHKQYSNSFYLLCLNIYRNLKKYDLK